MLIGYISVFQMATMYTFEDIVDFIGPVHAWPSTILERYKKLSYNSADRFSLCVFNYTNGFDNRIFLEYAIGKRALRDQHAVQHIKDITQILEQREKYLNTWYSFNLQENRWTFLNGQTKYY